MTRVRSIKLGTHVFTAAGSFVLYTAPTGYTIIVKSVIIENSTGAPLQMGTYVIEAVTGNPAFLSNSSVPASSSVNLNCWVVLNAGDTLNVNSAASGGRFWASGAQLTLP